MDKINTYLENTPYKHVLFWIVVYACYTISSSWDFYENFTHLALIFVLKVSLQIVAAYTLLLVLIPRYQTRKNILEVILSVVVLLIIIHFIYLVIKIGYFEPTFPSSYLECLIEFKDVSIWSRALDLRGAILQGPVVYLLPGFILIVVRYYRKQQKLLELNEQKKSTELTHLRNQLNPHFLFNTLNNLYALAIQKSDKTPDVIGKLSDILDYMLYRCNDKYVSLEKEIGLIENYLTLEKIRYGKRVVINFNTSLEQEIKIAPLLLLTFIENAFKHGVSQELNQAKIDIDLKAEKNEIAFSIKNTIPNVDSNHKNGKESIGLKNVKKQLELLYPFSHQLKIDQTEKIYAVELNIKTDDL